ncbi:MAG: thioredoxin family protein, partial [Deltaproteobacteria bacterium]|nr:thioredoxin family protein [Deltaproteobacteria bacterium]
DFTRDHCLPCKIMAPWVDELRQTHAAQVAVVEINIDRPENKPLGRFFKTRSIPTQVYVDEQGREVSRNVGLATKPQMERTLKRLGFLKQPETKRKSRK